MIHRVFGADQEDYGVEDEDINDIFDFGGKANELSETGKQVLDKMLHGKQAMKVAPFQNRKPGRPALCLDFYEERARCLKQKVLFEDPEFPAELQSIYPDGIPPDHSYAKWKKIEWKRPGELSLDPQLISGGISRFDAKQGYLGNCYMIATTANLAMHEELFYRVVPPDQSFTEDYAGIFHFQIWHYGHWVDVVIDDRLPTVDGKLKFMRSADENEFWSALLEKAYAKVYGSYYVIEGGEMFEVMEDYTGGIIEIYETTKVPRQSLLEVLKRAVQMGSLVTTGITERYNYQKGNAGGLYGGHAYSITAVSQVTHLEDSEMDLIRIRNPHGGKTEWTGPWGEESDEWNHVSEEDRRKLVQKPDGEFWMGFDDYMREFTDAQICTLGPEGIDELCQMTGEGLDMWNPKWKMASVNGQWSESGYEGGLEYNPQYLLHMPEEANCDGGAYTIILTLMQKYRREIRTMEETYFGTVTRRCVLKPGYYLLVPTAEDVDSECDFLFRILVNGPFELRELKQSDWVNIETYESKMQCDNAA